MITTYTGKDFNPYAPDPETINITDIAHHLSQVNRFGGAARFPLSVAQHSVYVSRLCDGTPYAMQALLHDASEAYLGDVTRWLKQTPAFAEYRALELVVQEAIFAKFHVPAVMAPEVAEADRLMVCFEAQKLLPSVFKSLRPEVRDRFHPPTEEERERVGIWTLWNHDEAEDMFMRRFMGLRDKVGTEPGHQLSMF